MNEKGKKIKYIVIVIILSIFFLGTMNFVKEFKGNLYRITINNNTNTIINGLELSYKSGEKIQTLTNFMTKEKRDYSIDTTLLDCENSIVIKGKNNENKNYEHTIVGYIEKGYTGDVVVNINGIDANGNLNIDIKENIY